MAVIKNEKTGKWEVRTYYKDLNGETKQKTKRGFSTKREAREWESSFKMQEHCDLGMTFNDYYHVYEKDMKPTIKLNTWLTKEHIIRTKILPYMGQRKVNELTPADVREWHTKLLQFRKKNGEPLSPDYLRTIHQQLSAMLNHAVRFYGLKKNVANVAGEIGGESEGDIKFWTQEEYERFAEQIANKGMSYYAFEVLYWCGLRMGELLALRPVDIDFNRGVIKVTRSYQRIHGKDVITDPKTPKSNREVYMPDSLNTELKCFLETLYKLQPEDRIFTLSKSILHHEMNRGAKAAGLERIKIHGLRHSHVSLLIKKGFSVVEIGNRVGHESATITFRYAHMFPSAQTDMADSLDKDRAGDEDE